VFARSQTRLVKFCNNEKIDFSEFGNFIEVVKKYKNKIAK
jgi:2-hydroxy-3-keto-5-methylthiopentenyl-1-phosphate phosphatase